MHQNDEHEKRGAINSRDEWAVSGGGKVPALAQMSSALPKPAIEGAGERRLGERLREWVVREMPPKKAAASLDSLSRDIDADGAEIARESVLVAAKLHLLRRQVEEAVERLKQAEIEGEPTEDEWVRVPLLLAELGRIFGERPEADGAALIAQEEEARFGNRIRAQGALREADRLGLADLADAIDRDAEALLLAERKDKLRRFREEWQRDSELISLAKQEHGKDLRRQVGEAVERLRYAVTSGDTAWGRGVGGQTLCSKDVLDAEQLTAELDRIFGERPEGLLDGTEAILDEFLPWALETFPDSTPKSCAAHLRKEAEELLADPLDRGEIADVLFLAIDLCQRAGIRPAEVLREKLATLRTRTWGEPDADGVVEHVRAEGADQ